ncbi:hypothetical protein LX32DRAFT_120232 [Colletotrichum zoysiae]|uniref:Uncharacterized protein n=1 Tax=Colletotrichum zoysiae TaxID=1216348 RepID=A0AAD9LZI3_9PEZI|nr:hypothetical protein LX32DRAFT_120232 [Colletotrichum zoysiae]
MTLAGPDFFIYFSSETAMRLRSPAGPFSACQGQLALLCLSEACRGGVLSCPIIFVCRLGSCIASLFVASVQDRHPCPHSPNQTELPGPFIVSSCSQPLKHPISRVAPVARTRSPTLNAKLAARCQGPCMYHVLSCLPPSLSLWSSSWPHVAREGTSAIDAYFSPVSHPSPDCSSAALFPRLSPPAPHRIVCLRCPVLVF